MSKENDTKQRVMQHFARAMEKELEHKNWTRNRLKKESGVGVERFVLDKAGNADREPTLSSAVRIADALGLSLDEMCGRTKYARDMDDCNVGECIDVILSLLRQLGGTINSRDGSLSLPDSNVTELLKQAMEYGKEYTTIAKFEPERYTKTIYEARRDWLLEKARDMKNAGEPIKICLEGSDTFTSFEGEKNHGPDYFEVMDDFEYIE